MKLSRSTIIVLFLSLVTILAWIGYQINLNIRGDKNEVSIEERYLTPLNPNLDQKLINDLREGVN